jgi:hypothetical protein
VLPLVKAVDDVLSRATVIFGTVVEGMPASFVFVVVVVAAVVHSVVCRAFSVAAGI